ncbi:phosphatidate cytidylyltransferase [Mangrovimonas sp. AS39]|uniref:phosphatidate cytidylyltransferase n=1 Tax=Mangrovimonas TaxID=1211036 RepID=UPI00141E55AB|nr:MULTISPECIES: phosphatidate cytidylyltransferase [Mangrovimonas]MCF1192560.1 phosphatidate cytidylyltransferase [Mangrovimonas futianensis]MCF1196110.1 phosphatidate cytidylyltransferase [Mangrovimonas futianensis]MCF1422495.1 phosphatidate cytidylyltransferase [Mangrovimonas futianensis]NIK93158.1 phosphatidate cytidylyltransferase [Mangrovimonas sp. CR14]
MKEVLIRSFSGLLYISLLICSMFFEHALVIVFFIFGLICMAEFRKLIHYKSYVPFISFSILYLIFGFWPFVMKTDSGLKEATQILHVITIFVQLFLIKDLFTHKNIPLFISKRVILTTFYLSSGFVFMILISKFKEVYNPYVLLGCFILVWTNDTFAYLVGKNFGKQKLFEKVSPKKTVEGFLGGLFFSCVASYFIATFTDTFSFTKWLSLGIIIAVFGTLGDLIESKFKRQAKVKDSGVIMPGHGGLLDRLDSMIFASPYIFLFLQLFKYVS